MTTVFITNGAGIILCVQCAKKPAEFVYKKNKPFCKTCWPSLEKESVPIKEFLEINPDIPKMTEDELERKSLGRKL